MISVVRDRFLYEYRDNNSRRFPETQLCRVKSAIESVEEDVFIETEHKKEVDLDKEIASHLESHRNGKKTTALEGVETQG